MTKQTIGVLLLSCLLFASFNAKAQKTDMGNSLQLTENRGQLTDQFGNDVPDVLYYMNTPGLNVYVTSQGLTYMFKQVIMETQTEEELLHNVTPNFKINWHRVDLKLEGSHISKNQIEAKPLPAKIDFYTGQHPEGIIGVGLCNRLLIHDVYPGIDWEILASTDGVKYNFIVKQGADFKNIKLVYEGMESIVSNGKGYDIVSKYGKLHEGEMIAFDASGKKIEGSALLANSSVSYDLNTENLSYPITIDPPLVWSTFYGGSGLDQGNCLAKDGLNNVFVGGSTASNPFPTLDPGGVSFYDGVFDGTSDGYVLKFDNNGVLLWGTYYGGTAADEVSNLYVNSNGMLAIVGFTTSTDFPLQNPGFGAFYQGTNGGGYDGFVATFAGTGNRLWSTYIGGSGDDRTEDVHISEDILPRTYVAGRSASANFPIVNYPGGYNDATVGIGDDVVMMRFNNLFNCEWSTYIGGDSWENGPSIFVDTNKNVYATFVCMSTAPTMPLLDMGGGAYYQPSYGGGEDFFIVKFNSSLVQQWGTYLGGTLNDNPQELIIDSLNQLWIAGYARSLLTSFPTVNPGGGAFFDDSQNGGSDAVFLKFGSNGQLLWSTYYGSAGNDAGMGVDFDMNGNVYFVGYLGNSISMIDPADGSYFDGTYAGGSEDGFLTRFNPSLNITWSTYMGSGGRDRLRRLAAAQNFHLFTTGFTESAAFPCINSIGGTTYYDDVYNAARDALVQKYIPCPENFAVIAGEDSVCFGEPVQLVVTGGTTYTWNTTETNDTINPLILSDSMLVVSAIGLYGCPAKDTFNVFVKPLPVISFEGDSTVCFGDSIFIEANGGINFLWDNAQTDSICDYAPAATEYLNVLVTNSYNCQLEDSILITVHPLPIPIVSGDAAICLLDTAHLEADGGISYEWGSGTLDSLESVVPTLSGINNYYVVVTDANGCADTAFYALQVWPLPIVDLGNDTTLCQGNSLIIDAGNPGSTYSWSTAESTQTISVNTAATYDVVVTDLNSCNGYDTLVVSVIPWADASITDIDYVCLNEPAFIYTTAESGGLWNGIGITNTNTGEFSPAVSGLGTFTLIYTISGLCGDADTTEIDVVPVPELSMISTNETCADANDGTVIIDASNGTAPLDLYFGMTIVGDTVTSIAPGGYIVTIVDVLGCVTADSVYILAEEFPCGEVGLYIPNIFSPNGDGQNDILLVRSRFIVSMQMIIYDRFGEKVFDTTDQNFGWDGNYNGEPVQDGVYYYHLKAGLLDGSNVEQKGNITIVR